MARKLPRRPGGSGLPKPPAPKPASQPTATPPDSPGPTAAAPRKAAPKKTAPRRKLGPAFPWAKWLKRGALVVTGFLAMISLLGGYVVMKARASLPQLEGSVVLAGLSGNVEVSRTALAVPHLQGGDIRDLVRAMGFVHAQDRFFQMELARRLGAGRLAELFGAELIEQDRLARRMGLAEAAAAELARTSPIGIEILDSYAAGVNAFRQDHEGRLSPELELLGHIPEPWSAVDSLIIAKWFSYLLSSNASVELLRARLVDAVGPENAYRLTGLAAPSEQTLEALPQTHPLGITALAPSPAELPQGASNAWVVDGTRSSSGRPLLAADPHLSLSMPSVFYEIRLSGSGIDVSGASLPGMPLVLFGQNRRIAWGVTALLADVQDIYVETVNPANPSQYAWGDQWLSFETVTASIDVKGQAPVSEPIERSHHGVIVGSSGDGRKLAQRWDALGTGDHVTALLWMNQSASWEEFTAALRGWSSPALAFVYADVEGNIGFFPAGDVPVRIGFDGSLPVDGRGQYEWQGAIPHDLKFRSFNPEGGVIVAANHQMTPPDAPYPLGKDTLAGFRALRIEELLQTGGAALSLNDFARIQQDRYDRSTEPVLRHAVALTTTNDAERGALEILRRWNGRMEQGPAPLIYHGLLRELLVQTLSDELGEKLFETFLEFAESGRAGGIHALLDDPSSALWDNRETPEIESREAIFQKSFTRTIETLSARYGEDASGWDWGSAHGVRFGHAMGRDGWLSWLFSRGPVPFGGSTHTIANAKASLTRPYEVLGGTSFRFLADLSDLSLSLAVIPTGASGHPLSPNYFDQNDAWLSGDFHPLAAGTPVSKMTLTP